MSNRLIKLPEVMKITSLSRSSVYMKMSQGIFPKQIKLGLRSSAWKLSEVEEWVEERVTTSRGDK